MGEYDHLPINTVFLADPIFNGGTQRVDFRVYQLVLPDGDQVEVTGIAYDLNGRAGIVGEILRDRESEVADAAGAAAVQMGKDAISTLTPNSMVGAGVNTFSQSMIDNENDHRPKKKEPVSVVSPQNLRIKLEKAI